jgi:hypothetical protein
MALPQLSPGFDDGSAGGPSSGYARYSTGAASGAGRAASPARYAPPPRHASPQRHASPVRPPGADARRDSYRGSFIEQAASASWDDLRAPAAPYDDGAGGGRQSPAYGGRASPAFVPNLPPRLSQPEGMNAYAFPSAGSPQRRAPLERTHTEDTLTRFPAAVDPAEPELDEASYPRARSPYVAGALDFRERTPSMVPSGTPPAHAPRHPAAPAPLASTPPVDPYGKLAAGPGDLLPPVSAPRAQPQTPRYVTNPAPRAAYAAAAAPVPEEYCPECSMRDQEMADVDVTRPGIWERQSDAAYFDLMQREEEDEAMGIPPSDDPNVPRAHGDPLTERLLKMWLSVVWLLLRVLGAMC